MTAAVNNDKRRAGENEDENGAMGTTSAVTGTLTNMLFKKPHFLHFILKKN